MRKKLVVITSLSIVGVLAIGTFSFFYFSFLHHYKGKDVTYNWSEEDEFDFSKIKTIEKQKDKDFKILNLADIQICDLENFFNKKKAHKEIDYLVDLVKPDLITLTGDQTWSNENLYAIKSIISWLEDYKIPFAPVFGNHDYGNEGDSAVASQRYICDLYEESEYSLFSRGPTNIDSLGNYVFNIMEGENIYRTIYMVDAGYSDEINEKQIDFFRWNKNGIADSNNGVTPSSLFFMHKPLPEYIDAYKDYIHDVPGVISQGEVYRYYSLSGVRQTGFFDFVKESNGGHVIAGHQHGNSFSLLYEGVWLTSALKTGEFGGFISNDDVYLNGATVLTLSDSGDKIERVFYEKGKF